MKKLRTILMTSGLTILITGFLTLVPVTVAAESQGLVNQSCTEALNNGFCAHSGSGSDTSTIQIKNLINLLMFALGAIGVIVIIIGGLKYVTSDGDAGKIKQAKDTILYAVIGIVVALMAGAIVQFIVQQFAAK